MLQKRLLWLCWVGSFLLSKEGLVTGRRLKGLSATLVRKGRRMQNEHRKKSGKNDDASAADDPVLEDTAPPTTSPPAATSAPTSVPFEQESAETDSPTTTPETTPAPQEEQDTNSVRTRSLLPFSLDVNGKVNNIDTFVELVDKYLLAKLTDAFHSLESLLLVASTPSPNASDRKFLRNLAFDDFEISFTGEVTFVYQDQDGTPTEEELHEVQRAALAQLFEFNQFIKEQEADEWSIDKIDFVGIGQEENSGKSDSDTDEGTKEQQEETVVDGINALGKGITVASEESDNKVMTILLSVFLGGLAVFFLVALIHRRKNAYAEDDKTAVSKAAPNDPGNGFLLKAPELQEAEPEFSLPSIVSGKSVVPSVPAKDDSGGLFVKTPNQQGVEGIISSTPSTPATVSSPASMTANAIETSAPAPSATADSSRTSWLGTTWENVLHLSSRVNLGDVHDGTGRISNMVQAIDEKGVDANVPNLEQDETVMLKSKNDAETDGTKYPPQPPSQQPSMSGREGGCPLPPDGPLNTTNLTVLEEAEEEIAGFGGMDMEEGDVILVDTSDEPRPSFPSQ